MRGRRHSSTTFSTTAPGLRVAVIVNDMSEVNIDARLVADGGAALSRQEEKLVEMSNGCICCTLRDDLLQEVRPTRRKPCASITSSSNRPGVSEPLPVAETFLFLADENGRSPSKTWPAPRHKWSRSWMRPILSATLDRPNAFSTGTKRSDSEDTRTIVDLLMDQIEFANVIVLKQSRCHR